MERIFSRTAVIILITSIILIGVVECAQQKVQLRVSVDRLQQGEDLRVNGDSKDAIHLALNGKAVGERDYESASSSNRKRRPARQIARRRSRLRRQKRAQLSEILIIRGSHDATPSPQTGGGVNFAFGVGIGSGVGLGKGTTLPHGSEYERIIQLILGRNYTPPATDSRGIEYVIILIRIARDGRILSISNGRVVSADIKQHSDNPQVNYAAERAVIASDPLPPFPSGFLNGVQEATAEVWFRYPK